MSVLELSATEVSVSDLEALRQFATGLDESKLRELLLGLTNNVEQGEDVALLDSEAELTPSQISKRLKISRTHLYKMLDNGVLPSHRVGRDRRVKFSDVVIFERQRQLDRHELAERLANPASTRDAAIKELMQGLE